MRVAAARLCWRSTRHAFASIRDCYLRCRHPAKKVVFGSRSEALRRVKRQKRTKKTSRRLPNETRTQSSTLKLKRGECMSAANFRVKKPKSCRLVSKLLD